MKHKNKFWIILYSVLATFLLYFFFLDISFPDGKLHIAFLNVGQGDGILITTPSGKRILVDGGPSSNILQTLPSKMSYFDNTIDLVVLTHPHSDHLAGLLPLFKRYTVPTILYTGIENDNQEYKAFLDMIQDKQKIIAHHEHDLLVDEGVYLDILAPTQNLQGTVTPSNDLNNTSVVFQLRYGKTKILFSGDAEKESENNILLAGSDIQSSTIKSGHHGSNTSSSPAFINAISPQSAMICVGKNNTFKHPSALTISFLKQKNIAIYRTDEQGTIDMTCANKDDCDIAWEKFAQET